jgi:hypothetical protein
MQQEYSPGFLQQITLVEPKLTANQYGILQQFVGKIGRGRSSQASLLIQPDGMR